MLNIIIFIGLIVAIFAAIGAWINTRIILGDLVDIKIQLGIKDERKPSIYDKDLDKD